MLRSILVGVGRLLVFLHVLIACALWSATRNSSFALQEANSQCQYGTAVSNPDFVDLRMVSTFHSLSIYWKLNGLSPEKAAYVLFKERGSNKDFRRSLDLVYSADDAEYRGSIVHLKSGTEYEIALYLDDVEIETVIGETWCEQFPIAETVIIPTGTQTVPYEISNVVGSPEGYILYTADPNNSNVLDGQYVANNIVIRNSAYVIVRGLNLINAQQDSIFLPRGEHSTHDIVIEDNVFESWGRINAVSGFGENDNAIRTGNGHGTHFERLIVQRNIIRSPRADSNSWAEFREDQNNCTVDRCHPKGPSGLYLKNTAGNHVIRYNEIYSANGNYFDDAIGGADDKSLIGTLHRDSDVYGNIVMNTWDDAIESEGGNMNVRIWGNYIDNAFVAFAIAAVSRGPIYIFRNIVHRTQRSPDEADNSGRFIKNQTTPTAGGGHAFVFHNTVFRRDGVGGVWVGITGSGTPLVNFMSRNNIVDAANHFLVSSTSTLTATNDFDYDLYQGDFKGIDGQEPYGIQDMAVYEADPLNPFILVEGSPGHNDGVVVPNFSNIAVDAPDMGAQERGGPSLEFGVNAYRVKISDGTEDPDGGPPDSGGFTLSATGLKLKSQRKVILEWRGATSAEIDIYRDGQLIATYPNTGFYTYWVEKKGRGNRTYQTCEARIDRCSNQARAKF